jgi:hypothetical protein
LGKKLTQKPPLLGGIKKNKIGFQRKRVAERGRG